MGTPNDPRQGYAGGNAFGDPNAFTRSTGEDEVDRYNQWMRSQPEWAAARGSNTGDWTDQQKQQLSSSLGQRGITLPDSFHIDEGGNFNQKSRVKRNLAIAAAIGGGALTAGLATGMIGPGMGGLFSGAGGAAGGATGAGSAGFGVLAPGAVGIGAGQGALAAGVGGTIAGGGSAVGGGLTGLLSGAAKNFGKQAVQDSISRGLGSYSQAQASNRGTNAELQLDANSALERELIAREQEKRTAQNDAYQNQIRGSLASNWQSPQAPRSGINVVRFGGPNGPANDQTRAAGAGLYSQATARLQAPDLQNQTGMPTYNNLMQNPLFTQNLKAGKGEKLAGIGSALTPLAGALLGRR